MKNYHIKGSSLAQYSIIIALIALALIPVFYLFGQNIISSFTGLQQGLSDKKAPPTSSTTTSSTTNVSPTSSTQTTTDASPANPIKKCTGGICTINFGDYVLSGIPEDINDFVLSTGSSGTTETLLKALEEIIANSDTIQTNADIDLLKEIAKHGHGIANNQKELEDVANTMLEDPSQPILSITGFSNTLERLQTDSNASLLNIRTTDLVNMLKNSQNQDDKNILAIVTFLVDDIKMINNNLYNIAGNVKPGVVNSAETYEAVLHPQSSTLTDLDSAIICNTGDGTDKGTECK